MVLAQEPTYWRNKSARVATGWSAPVAPNRRARANICRSGWLRASLQSSSVSALAAVPVCSAAFIRVVRVRSAAPEPAAIVLARLALNLKSSAHVRPRIATYPGGRRRLPAGMHNPWLAAILEPSARRRNGNKVGVQGARFAEAPERPPILTGARALSAESAPVVARALARPPARSLAVLQATPAKEPRSRPGADRSLSAQALPVGQGRTGLHGCKLNAALAL